jgi:hypothetical protein
VAYQAKVTAAAGALFGSRSTQAARLTEE